MDDKIEPSQNEQTIEILDSLGKILADNEIETAVITFIDPETNEIKLMIRGEFYEAAKLLGKTSNQIRNKISEDLNGLY